MARRSLLSLSSFSLFALSSLFLLFVGLASAHSTHEHNHEHHHHEEGGIREEIEKQVRDVVGEDYVVHVYAVIATAIVGCLPVLILSFLPPLENNPKLMNVLLAFAVGGLLGDVFLHLIPHAMDPHHHHGEEGHDHHGHDHHGHDHHGHDHDHHEHAHEHHDHHEHDHSHSNAVGLWVLAGLVSFLMIEKFVKILHGGQGHGHSHGHSHEKEKKEKEKKKEDKKDKKDKKEKENGKEKEKQKEKEKNTKVSAFLNLAADFCHNVTDGLAIGASFKASLNLGLLTTFAVLLHELPHEIGDYAILIQSGFTKKQAMVAQLYTAIGAMAGTVIALFAEGQAESSWILPFTAGGFVYIATTSVLPSLLEKPSLDLKQSFLEFFAIVLGIVLMLIVGLFE